LSSFCATLRTRSGVNGLAMYSTPPSLTAAATTEALETEVTRTTGVVTPLARILASAVGDQRAQRWAVRDFGPERLAELAEEERVHGQRSEMVVTVMVWLWSSQGAAGENGATSP
jgi:hypothetical protein